MAPEDVSAWPGMGAPALTPAASRTTESDHPQQIQRSREENGISSQQAAATTPIPNPTKATGQALLPHFSSIN